MFDEKSIHLWGRNNDFPVRCFFTGECSNSSHLHNLLKPFEANKHQLLLPQQSEPVGPVGTAGCKVIISHLAESRRFTGNEI